MIFQYFRISYVSFVAHVPFVSLRHRLSWYTHHRWGLGHGYSCAVYKPTYNISYNWGSQLVAGGHNSVKTWFRCVFIYIIYIYYVCIKHIWDDFPHSHILFERGYTFDRGCKLFDLGRWVIVHSCLPKNMLMTLFSGHFLDNRILVAFKFSVRLDISSQAIDCHTGP